MMMKTTRIWLVCGALAAMSAVLMGAFAAHGLRGHVPPGRLDVFATAADYQFLHALGLLLLGNLQRHWPTGHLLSIAAGLMLIGIFLFSGSLYFLVLFDWPALGMVTPFGGVALVAAWGVLAVAVWQLKN